MKPTREEVLVPKWAGQFDSFVKWINHASIWLQSPSQQPAVCIDAKGRRCSTGKDFMRARDEGAFPVRYFWEFEVAAKPVVPTVEQVEDVVGMGSNAWDCVSPIALIEAVLWCAGMQPPNTAGQPNEQNAVQTEQPSLSDAEIVITLAEHGIGLMSHTSDVEPFPLDGDDAPIFIAAYRALLAQPQDRKYEERFRWIEENCHTEGGGKGFTIFVPVDHEDIGCGIDIAIANGAPVDKG